MKLRYMAAAAVLISAAVLAPGATASAASSGCPAASNSIWAGYAVCARNYTYIGAVWTVPAAHGGGNKISADWVGLGGLGTGVPLEQEGTVSNVSSGKALYYAWWEHVCKKCSRNAVHLNVKKYPVRTGDVMVASIAVTHGDRYDFKVTDEGRRGDHYRVYFSTIKTFRKENHKSAEVIVEDPFEAPLTHFGKITFTQVTANNNVMGVYTPQKFTLPDGKVSVSDIGQTAEFSVTFKHD